METLPIFVRDRSQGQLLAWHHQMEACELFRTTPAQVEEVALERGILPARYQRNREVIPSSDQLKLFKSRVAIIGCGGLGGYVVEQLARLGVGEIVIIDPDCFEEHNLNRQIFSNIANLGTPKVAKAAARVSDINPAVTVVTHQTAFTCHNGVELLSGCSVVVDALDSITVRRELGRVCSSMGLPLVHGAIAGWYGHIVTQLPGEQTLQLMYGDKTAPKGIEQQQGNPAFTPAVIASLQSAEVCKLLLGTGTTLHGRQIMIDMLNMEFNEIQIPTTNSDGP